MDPGDVVIRVAHGADAAALAELARRTFEDTFAADNDPTNIATHVAHAFGVAQQAAEIANPDVFTLVGEAGGALVAFAQLRRRPGARAPKCVRAARPIEVWRFYVDRAWHGGGLAARLMDAALARAASLGADAAWLGVWEKNPRAIRFYAKHGFVDVGAHVFEVGADAQTDRVMQRALSQ
ncbi:MAG TPA: GNAT family N-acetyltransferase [Labilithrix sp.]|jgi:GNAT superfamily N-acetyltransferase